MLCQCNAFKFSPDPSVDSRRLANIRAVPKPPPRLKIKRAKVVVSDAGVKRLTVCESCGEEKYIAEGESVCDDCKARAK